MTPAARLQAASEILDQVIASAEQNGAPADVLVTRYFKTRRYAGSKDRRAVRELVFKAIRRAAEAPATGREAILGLAADDPELVPLFGQPRGPEPIGDGEMAALAGTVPEWIAETFSPLIGKDEHQALLERAPVDLRVNIAKTTRDAMIEAVPGARATKLSPWCLRLEPDSRVDTLPVFADGLIEIQDEGSQLIALACAPTDGQRIIDLCAGAGGKTLALAAAALGADLLATDSNRARLSQLTPRAERAGTRIATLLLNPPRELDQLADWTAAADTVLVDAPCSGSGTWRRNPEGRWRLTPERLENLVESQARLLEIGSALVKPGGTLVYAVCSLIASEGAGQVADFLRRHSSWVSVVPDIKGGRIDGDGRLLTPARDHTDGFFIACLKAPC